MTMCEVVLFFYYFLPENTDVVRESPEFQAYFSMLPLSSRKLIKTNQPH